jgi:hypothetical protein
VQLYHEVQPGEEICYYDVTSLYPWICAYKKFPVGEVQIRRGTLHPADVMDKQWFGFALVTVLPPRELYMPVLPMTINNKLVFTLCVACARKQVDTAFCRHKDKERSLQQQIFTSVELGLALRKGYTVLKVHEIWHWEKTSDLLFRDFLLLWFKIKLTATPLPTDIEPLVYCTKLKKEFGFDLKPKDFVPNPGLRLLAKTHLNSFWGKMGQRLDQEKNIITSSREKVQKLLSNKNATNINIVGLGKKTVMVSWKDDIEHTLPAPHLSLPIAIFTTSYARAHLYEEGFEKMDAYSNLLYFDTDSLAFIHRPGDDNIPCLGNGELGSWSNEMGPNKKIKTFFSAGPKCYGLKVQNTETQTIEWITRSKGIKYTVGSLKELSIDDMYNAVLQWDQSPKLITDPLQIRKNRNKGELKTIEQKKKWKINLTKRVVLPCGKRTLPFGYYGV